jgi:hypothetical protein
MIDLIQATKYTNLLIRAVGQKCIVEWSKMAILSNNILDLFIY